MTCAPILRSSISTQHTVISRLNLQLTSRKIHDDYIRYQPGERAIYFAKVSSPVATHFDSISTGSRTYTTILHPLSSSQRTLFMADGPRLLRTVNYRDMSAMYVSMYAKIHLRQDGVWVNRKASHKNQPAKAGNPKAITQLAARGAVEPCRRFSLRAVICRG